MVVHDSILIWKNTSKKGEREGEREGEGEGEVGERGGHAWMPALSMINKGPRYPTVGLRTVGLFLDIVSLGPCDN